MIWMLLTEEVKDGGGVKTALVGKFPLSEREFELIAENWEMYCRLGRIDPQKVYFING